MADIKTRPAMDKPKTLNRNFVPKEAGGIWKAHLLHGNILIVHCASGYNNVVITGKEGFASIGRPLFFAE